VPAAIRIPWSYFVTGAYILSKGDNASFLHDATEDYRGKPYTKLTRARWRRVLRRNLALTVPVALLLAAVTPWVALWAVWVYLSALALAGLSWATWRGRAGIQGWRMNREWIDPAAAVACRVLNVRYTKKAGRRMIELPRGWGSGAEGESERQKARVHVPAGTPLSAGMKKQFVENVGARLGIPKPVQGDWQEAGSHVQVELSAAPVPPKEVTYASLLPAIARAAEDEVVVGRKAGGEVVTISLSGDSPHLACSGASNTGKSVLVRVILRQRIERGDGVVITDPKRFSHWRWAGKLSRDRVVYAYKAEDLHAAWMAVGEETIRRRDLPEEELEKQRRVWLVAEELNAQIKILARFWRGERRRIMLAAKTALADAVDRCDGNRADGLALAIAEGLDEADLDPPTISPAIVALQEVVFMGREFRMNMLAAAQRLSAGVFGGGGGDVRESFQGGRFLAKWDRKLWKMLVDTIDYVACPSGPRGIWGVARGEDFDIFRVPWLSEQEMATACLAAAPVHGPVLGEQLGHGQVDGQVVGHSERKAISAAVTLAMALGELPGQDGPRALSMDGLRTAARRPGFPAPLAKPDGSEYGQTEARLYDLAELVDWRERVLAD
jgi:hypothetical protein